ncbi:HlyD family secretion protein [Roseibium sp. RKSG952]|uniref:HlyD family secretion protein n=1 Tax=Roseibium sp. RKSG952 TaxID=2529384 RepID=UPI0018AD1189
MSWLLNRVSLLVFAGAILIGVLYEVSRSFVVYTGEAYVTTDVVILAPQVAGFLAEIKVRRDQGVQKGDLLFTLDPTLYQLTLDAKTAALREAQANKKRAVSAVAEAWAEVTSAQADVATEQENTVRFRKIFEQGDISTAAMDAQTDKLSTAKADLNEMRAGWRLAQDEEQVATEKIEAAKREVAIAQYRLNQTKIHAPTSGRIAPYNVGVGDYLAIGDEVLAVIDDTAWQVVANLWESDLNQLEPGAPVLFTLSTEGWTFHQGSVDSLSPAVALTDEKPGVIPYVDPDTNWIRLPKRFPVRIDVGDLPDRRRLFMNSDVDLFLIRSSGLARLLGLPWEPVHEETVENGE